MQLYDPGHRDDEFLEKRDVQAHQAERRYLRRFVASLIRESAEFRPHLTLRITPRLVLPPRQRPRDSTELLPVVRSVRSSFSPEVSVPVSAVSVKRVHDLQVDPLTGALEWRGEAMESPLNVEQKDERAERKEAERKDDGPRRFRSKPMELNFTRPGELFTQQDLSVEVCVEVPDELLSGTQVRLFTATGEPEATGSRRVLQTRTVITTHCRVILHDAFLRRQISPSQTVSFDEIVPDAQRVSDVRAALEDQRFEVECASPSGRTRASAGWNTCSIATRRDGPDTIQLWIYVEGRRHPTQRESRHVGAPLHEQVRERHPRHPLPRASSGDARGVTREINNLHLALRERFRRMKALR